ncbi:hypothetical protein AMATHDRAFT_148903 [Amanita thiersii Skay4041]|uniref:Major facilitator superfamily (MFS) profile domain-containing protein n=1 Tax=Amanita thiersii Skay4041 TaxID=703135 RepID=A0A2A9NHU0_9AGAR|nr:hypothetical protein AMATHDRAFT_148903 [Amanita thiersii Skay4041]
MADPKPIPQSNDEKICLEKEKSDATTVASTDVVTSTKSPRSRKQVILGRLQFATLCYCAFVIGWNDGSTGPLLPRIQDVYHVNYTIASLIFVLSCTGIIIGSLLNLFISDKLGLGKVPPVHIASSCQSVAYLLQSLALPFPVFVLSFLISGFGIAFEGAQGNGFVVALKDHTKMGLFQAFYGMSAGAMVAPLVSTQFAQLEHWSFYYFITCGLSLLETFLFIFVFRLQSQDGELCQTTMFIFGDEKGALEKIKVMMKAKAVHLIALFLLVYIGLEVTNGGWTVTYIIRFRGGGPSSGYVSTGYFAGLTLGRVALLWVNQKLGESRAVLVYVVLALGFQFIVWFVPSIIGDAIAIAFVGFFLGPMYPLAMNHCGQILPPWIITNSIGWINAIGFAGSALIPFITGAIAQRWGIQSLQPILVVMMCLMTIIWLCIPKKPQYF